MLIPPRIICFPPQFFNRPIKIRAKRNKNAASPTNGETGPDNEEALGLAVVKGELGLLNKRI